MKSPGRGENSVHDVIINLISYEDMNQISFLVARQLPIFNGFIEGQRKYDKTDHSLNRPRKTDQIKV